MDGWQLDRSKVIENVKSIASDVITAKYPEWKQINLQSDSSYAQNAISGLVGITADEVMMRAVGVIGLTDDIDALKAFEETVNTNNVGSTVDALQINELYIDLIKEYFVSIAKSIIAYRLIRLVRTWSNNKEMEVNEADDISAVLLDDYPNI